MTKEKINQGIKELTTQRDKLEERIRNGYNLLDKIKKDELIEIEKRIKIEGYSQDHVKLLKRMCFEGIFYGDLVSIGACGKRPFGNSSMYNDIAQILEWELPNDDLSDDQFNKADMLLKELPFALNYILKDINLN